MCVNKAAFHLYFVINFRYQNNRMRQIACLWILLLFFAVAGVNAQPFALSLNNVDGSPYTCTPLEDLGTYKRLRVQATQSSADGRWEFPQTCSFPGNVWRPYTDAEATPIPFNQVIPPTPSTYAALWNSSNGGAPGRLQPITNGYYYTFNVENIDCNAGLCESPHIGVLETPYLPVDLISVSQLPSAAAVTENTPVTITVTSSAPPIENVFVRYTTNEFVNTTIVPVLFSGTTGTATIPGFANGTTVRYYVYSSNKSQALIESEVVLYGEITHDMSTLKWNIDVGTNYSYVVAGTTPVTLEYFKGSKQLDQHLLQWKAACLVNSPVTMTIERAIKDSKYTALTSLLADGVRCSQPFEYADKNIQSGTHYYRIRFESTDGQRKYSNIVAINNRIIRNNHIQVIPNLIENNVVRLQFQADKANIIRLNILDPAGRLLYQKQSSVFPGLNNLSIDVPSLKSGLYFIKVTGNFGQSATQSFIIK